MLQIAHKIYFYALAIIPVALISVLANDADEKKGHKRVF